MADSSTGTENQNGAKPEDENLLPVEGQEGSENASESGENSAGSPAAETQDDNKPKDMLAAVTAALEVGKEQSSGSGESGEKPAIPDPKAAKPEDKDELGPLTQEELNSYKGKTKRRFEKLDRENKALTAEVEGYKALGDPAQVKAEVEGFRSIAKFSRDAGLNREEVNAGFNIMKLMKNDPVECYKHLRPIWDQLCATVGVYLPKDLHDKVVKGEITREHAQEMSALRAKSGLTDHQRTQQQTTQAQQAAATAKADLERTQTEVKTAVTEWENSWKAKDPDFTLKHARWVDAVELELLRLKQKGDAEKSPAKYLPKTAAEAVKLSDDVKKRVEEEYKRFIPKKQAITHISGNGVNKGSKPVANSYEDAIKQALGHN